VSFQSCLRPLYLIHFFVIFLALSFAFFLLFCHSQHDRLVPKQAENRSQKKQGSVLACSLLYTDKLNMFIKKDLRKIPTILADAASDEAEMETDETTKHSLTDLPLQRRKAEFDGNVKILCQPSNAPALRKLKSLSLYDCEIVDLTGIGLCENLVHLNVGRNPIQDLPKTDFAQLSSLETLCLDDCDISGPLPEAITSLRMLQELRMANNKITEIPDTISNLQQLTVLGLDNNRLTALPDALTTLSNLKTLLLRSNELTVLPDNLPNMISLELLHVSSNKLTALPDSLVECLSLTHIYANSNQLKTVPAGLETLPELKHLNLSHCKIEFLTCEFFRSFGHPNSDGLCIAATSKVLLTGNPVLKKDEDDNVGMEDVAEEDTSGD